MRNIFAILSLPLLALTACGEADPTPDAEKSAPAAAINASVDKAQAQADRASDAANAADERAEAGSGAQPE